LFHLRKRTCKESILDLSQRYNTCSRACSRRPPAEAFFESFGSSGLCQGHHRRSARQRVHAQGHHLRPARRTRVSLLAGPRLGFRFDLRQVHTVAREPVPEREQAAPAHAGERGQAVGGLLEQLDRVVQPLGERVGPIVLVAVQDSLAVLAEGPCDGLELRDTGLLASLHHFSRPSRLSAHHFMSDQA